MLESVIQKKTAKKAEDLGFFTRKIETPFKKGFPDRMFISPKGKLFFIEFKSSVGKLGKLQVKTIEELRVYGQTVYVVNNLEQGLTILKDALM